jgi:hypothetical protein
MSRSRTFANGLMYAAASIGLLMGLGSVAQAQALKTTSDRTSITVVRCDRYIQSAKWVYRDHQWSFAITPTPCGRETQPDSTPFLWDELTRDYSNSRYWANTHGMRHQVICHLAIARDKPEWFIEPGRPDVGYDKTLAAGCNHTEPLPEPAP